jgi:dynein light intermediate chain
MAAVSATSLVKYDTAELVTGKNRRTKVAVPKLDRRNALPATEDLLNAILPPREWTQDSQLWVQKASSTPATRLDVINLQEQLDLRLQQRQARETGICPIREELYAQCFGQYNTCIECAYVGPRPFACPFFADELIRQVTVNCAERGLLLLAVRNEIRMTIASYQSLYESSIAFGMRKALMAEQRRSELAAKVGAPCQLDCSLGP